MKNVQLSHRMYSISDIKRLRENKDLIIQPKYQRRRTKWPQTAKTSLIDTVLNNYPIQPIYLREYVTSNKERKKEIIDGQQRISTIIEFIYDKYELSNNFSNNLLIGYKFSELPFETQQEILDYELSFISIKNATESDIISIFSRLNSYTLPLNSQEKRNALWSGQFKTLIYKLSALYSSFWNDFKIFSDKAIARMREAQIISEIIVISEIGYKKYSGKKIDEFYKKYDVEFPNYINYYESFNYVMSIIGNVLEDDRIRSLFSKQSWFFTLFLAIFDKTFFTPGSENKSFKPKNIDINSLKDSLIKIVSDYNNKRIPEETLHLFQQGTASSSNREKRHSFLINLI